MAMARADCLEEVESDEENMLLGGAESDATWDVLTAPAPHHAALAFKLEVFRDNESYMLTGVNVILDCMIADARRLGKNRQADLGLGKA